MLVWFTHLLNFIIIDMHFKQSTVLATESQIRQNESESFRILIHQMEETFKFKSKSMVGRQGSNYHWGRRGSCLVRFSQKKKEKERERKKKSERQDIDYCSSKGYIRYVIPFRIYFCARCRMLFFLFLQSVGCWIFYYWSSAILVKLEIIYDN